MVSQQLFGKTADGEEVYLFRLENSFGMAAEVISYGCALRSLIVPDRTGAPVDVVLGYDTLAEYISSNGCLGAVVGRFANRIGNGSFTLNGKTYTLAQNNFTNCLHGGTRGFDKVVWRGAAAEGDRVVFTRRSPDGEEGFPGTLDVQVVYTLTQNALTIDYSACTDTDTVINLTNHAYFNLNGGGSVLDHALTVPADTFTENSDISLPTGKLLAVAGTPLDFRTAKPIGWDIDADCEQIRFGSGYDHNFVLGRPGCLKTAAIVHSARTGLTMTVTTDLPGVQVYSANHLGIRSGKNGAQYDSRFGVCLETQQFPDAPNKPEFPSSVLKKGESFCSTTSFQFAAE